MTNDKDEVIFDSEYVASNLNSFFTGIASKIVSEIPPCNLSLSDVDDFYEKTGVSQNSFRLAVVTE